MAAMSPIKEQAHKVIDDLPENATWQDIAYRFYVLERVQEGLRAIKEGRVTPHDEVKKKFLKK